MTEQTTEVPVVEDEKTERTRKLREAYSAATTRLRESHRTDFDSLYSEEAEARGVTYNRRPTPQEKAKQQVEEMLRQHPELAETFGIDPASIPPAPEPAVEPEDPAAA